MTTLMTAKEFWTLEMPKALDLLMNEAKALREDTQKAVRVANGMGIEVEGDRLPYEVWDAFYQF